MTNCHHARLAVVETLVRDIDNNAVEDLGSAFEIDVPIPQRRCPLCRVVGNLHDLM